ncbi:MAG: hypothetical protein PHR06_05055 [Candidatus Cloacimonetes bacterium]|nr:hypothetical protein [Candidatus Cloacimonadota bacterium]
MCSSKDGIPPQKLLSGFFKNYLFFTLICFVCLISCSDTKKLRIGIIDRSIGYLPIETAFRKNLFDFENYSFKRYKNSEKLISDISKNKIDVAVLSLDKILGNYADNKNIRIISGLQKEGLAIISDQKEINENSSVGYISNDITDFFVFTFLKTKHPNAKFIPFRENTQLSRAFAKSEINALFYSVPHIYKFIKDKQVIYWSSEDYPLHPASNLVANPTAINEKAKTIKALLEIIEAEIILLTEIPSNFIEAASVIYMLSESDASDLAYNTDFLIGISETDKKFIAEFSEFLINKETIPIFDYTELYDYKFTKNQP